jgi:hypothetical protein
VVGLQLGEVGGFKSEVEVAVPAAGGSAIELAGASTNQHVALSSAKRIIVLRKHKYLSLDSM